MTTIPSTLTSPIEAAKILISLKERVLSLQSSDERLSAAEAKLLPAAIQAAQRQLVPTTSEIMTVEIRKLADWAKAFNVPAADLKTAAASYTEALKHLPPDLLAEAFRAIKAVHKWGMRLPLPVEILATVTAELTERRRLLAKLEIAKSCAVEPERGPPTAEEKQKVTDILAQWRSRRDNDTIATPT